MKKCLVLFFVILFMLSVTACNDGRGVSSDSSGAVTQSGADIKPGGTDVEGEDGTTSEPQGGDGSENSDSRDSTETSNDTAAAPTDGKKPQSTGGNRNNVTGSDKPQSTGSENDENKNDGTKKCDHKYERKEYEAPDCTRDGYEKLICTVCGDVKTEKLSAKKHSFVDFICSECGIADKENAVGALNSWVEKNGKRKDSSSPYEFKFETDDGEYTLSSYASELTLSFLSSSSEISETLTVDMKNSEKCDITYYLDGVTASIFGIKRSEALSESSEEWDKLTFTGNTEADTAKLKKALIERTQDVLATLNANGDLKKLSVSPEDLGFSPDSTDSKQNG